MPRNYVDNKMNRELGRVGMPVGSAVHSRNSSSSHNSRSSSSWDSGISMSSGSSSSHKTYVDSPLNRSLGRVGMEHGTAVHSSGNSMSSGSSSSHKTYVDNPMNRSLGRVGMEHGTAVHSSGNSMSSGSSSSHKTYVDSPLNRSLGRVGMEHGTAVHSSGNSMSSGSSSSHKTYVDSPLNRSLGRVGMEHGTAVHSRSDTPKTYVDNTRNQELGRVGLPHGAAVHSIGKPETKVYVDNAFNSRHNRVGLPLGSAPVSRKNELYQDMRLNKMQQEPAAVSNHKNCITPEKKVYVDNAFNRKHNRVGLPLGSVPISRNKEVYKDSLLSSRKDRVGKPWGTCTGVKNKLHELFKHLEERSDDDEDIPAEFEAMSDDDFTYVMECLQREQAITQNLAENVNNDWQPYEHTLAETIKKYKGQIIDYEKLQIGAKIGHGGFGEVYLAALESGEAVAVKKLKDQQVTKKRLQLFKIEMDFFLQLDHPNIVSFIGACLEVPNLAIVMELMDMSLFDAIHIRTVDLNIGNKLEITRGVTDGMAYLHFQDIAHCDLKTKNVLLINVPGEPITDSSKPVRAKITDFGLSKMKSDVTTSSSLSNKNIGTPLYSAPEIHQGKILSLEDLKKADIFSLGLLIWELVVEEIPFDLSIQQLKVQVGEKGLRPVAPGNLRLDGKLQETLSLCWSEHPDKRPSADDLAEIAYTLTNLLEEREE